MRCAFSCATSSTCTVTPLPRSSLRARPRHAAGGFSFDGVLTMSRAQITASPIAAPRSSAALHRRAAVAPTITTFFSFDGFGVALVLEELVRAEHEALGDGLRGLGDVELGCRVDAASSPPTWPCSRAARSRPRRGAGRRA